VLGSIAKERDMIDFIYIIGYLIIAGAVIVALTKGV